MTIFDEPDGRKALEKIGCWAGTGPPAPEDCRPMSAAGRDAATVAMIDWLDERHAGLAIEHLPGSGWSIVVWQPDTPTSDVLVKKVLAAAPTRAEALIAAVLATGE